MEIVYEGDGFKIVHGGRTIFVRNGPINSQSWTQAEKEAAAQESFNSYLDSIVKVNYFNKVRYIYNTLVSRPFEDSNGIKWVNGFDSVQKLDGARRLAIEAGLTEITFFDVNDEPHVLPIADATQVVLELGMQLQTLIGKKNTLFTQIKDAADEAALEAIDMPTIFGIDPNDSMFL